MIPRTLVPFGARPAASVEEPPKRLSSLLDARTLVAADLPVTPLDPRSSIPTHLPLEVLAVRLLVPRDLPIKPLEASSSIPHHVPLTVLDSRVAVPKDAKHAPIQPLAVSRPRVLPDIIEPDVLTTGEVNLLAETETRATSRWTTIARVGTIAYHGALIAFLLLWPTLFPYRQPTREEMELARQQLSFVYLPPSVDEVPAIPNSPNEPTSPQVRIDPRILRQVAPPEAEPQLLPGPAERERVVRELPNAPTPQLSTPAPDNTFKPAAPEAPREAAKLESPKPLPEDPGGLRLPGTSPGKALEESIRGAARNRPPGGSVGLGGQSLPPPGGGGLGGGRGFLDGGIEVLTPLEGVDFSNYLARVLASVRRNWYAVMPESARLGDKGRVVLQFRILRNGSVPFPEPALMLSSSKESLDRAALSAIRASNPFEPLPQAFSGPHIELRFIFLYNLRLQDVQ